MTPAVSVLLPARNAAATLHEALASLRQQTFARFEIILVDDGSTDDTAAVARAVWPGDSRLHVITPGRVGLVGALREGLEHCRAPYVARMDADDIAAPGRLELQAAYLDGHPDVHIAGSQVRTFAPGGLREGYRAYDDWQNQLLDHDAIVRELFVESPLAHPSVMFRRDAVVELGGYRDCGWPEDYDLWLRAAEAGLRFGKVAEVLLHWRDSPERTSRRDRRYASAAFLRCKAHFLARGPLASGRPVVLWGGAVAGKLGRMLREQAVELRAFVDVDPRKVGGRRGAVPVIGPEQLPRHRECFLLAAVGSRGARQLIRAEASRLGWNEGVDFLCAA